MFSGLWSWCQVGLLFDVFGVHDSREEIELDQFVSKIAQEEAAYRAFQQANPFRYHFANWDPSDSSLQNLLNALYFETEGGTAAKFSA